jgi:hypothetical protein
MISLHTRARCDECDRPAVVEADPDCFLCELCAEPVNSVTSASSSPDVNAVVTVDLAPGPSVATATNSELMCVEPSSIRDLDAGRSRRTDCSPIDSIGRDPVDGAVKAWSPGLKAVTGGNSDPVSSIPPAPVHSAPRSEKGAAPLLSSALGCVVCDAFDRFGPYMMPCDLEHDLGLHSSSEAMDIAAIRKAALAPPTSSDPELETAISALEADWRSQDASLAEPPAIPALLRRSSDNVAPFMIRADEIDQNSMMSRTFAASEIAPKFSVSLDDISKPSAFSVGA